MKYASVCSGIEAASVAWKPLGWDCEFLSEIEKHPKSLLEDKYGHETTIYGDFTNINASNHKGVDVIIGGTPCQSFSMAGARGGLEDARGNLSLEFIRLGKALKSRWIVWENVPGVLSSAKGADLTTILSEFVGRELPTIKWSKAGFIEPTTEADYGIAWRILDGQHFGVPQRRRRLFVVGYLGDWRPPCSVLFEPESHSRDTEKSRSTGQATTRAVGESHEVGAETDGAIAIHGNGITTKSEGDLRFRGDGYLVEKLPTLTNYYKHAVVYENHGQAGRVKKVGSLPALNAKAGTGGGNLPIVYEYRRMDTRMREVEILPVVESAYGTGGGNMPIVYANTGTNSETAVGMTTTITAKTHKSPPVVVGKPTTNGADTIRYITPRECERAMGFPDDYTIKLPKTARYKALGNSMIVPTIQWIGQRIEAVDGCVGDNDVGIIQIMEAFKEDGNNIELLQYAIPYLESLSGEDRHIVEPVLALMKQRLATLNEINQKEAQ